MSNKAVILELLKAKKFSDNNDYHSKGAILEKLLEQHPKDFIIDSRQKRTVGLTHQPSGFRIHTLKGRIPLKFLEHHRQ